MIQLAPIDYKILAILDENALLSSTQIAKTLRVSPDTVQYHLTRLQRSGVIERAAPVIDLSRLGLQLFRVSLKLSRVTKLESKLKQLFVSPFVTLVVQTRGLHDAIVWGNARNAREIQECVWLIQHQLASSLSSFTVEIISDTRAYSRGYLVNRPGQVFPARGGAVPVRLDEIDLACLQELSQDARLPLTEIAQRIGTTAAIVRYRQQKLEDSGVIVGYRLHLNSEAFGMQRFRVQLEVRISLQDAMRRLEKFCRTHPGITRLEQHLGAWPIELGIEASGFSAVHDMLEQLRIQTKEGVSVRGIDFFHRSYLSQKISWAELLSEPQKKKNRLREAS